MLRLSDDPVKTCKLEPELEKLWPDDASTFLTTFTTEIVDVKNEYISFILD
jgi:hypothetical protein